MRLMATKSYSFLIFYLLVEHYGLLLLMNRAFSIITRHIIKGRWQKWNSNGEEIVVNSARIGHDKVLYLNFRPTSASSSSTTATNEYLDKE